MLAVLAVRPAGAQAFGVALGSGEKLRWRDLQRSRELGDHIDRRIALRPLDPAYVVAVHSRVEVQALLGDFASFFASRFERLTEADKQWIRWLWHHRPACSLTVSRSTA